MIQPMCHAGDGSRARAGLFGNGAVGNVLCYLLDDLPTLAHGLELGERAEITKKLLALVLGFECQYGREKFFHLWRGGHMSLFYYVKTGESRRLSSPICNLM